MPLVLPPAAGARLPTLTTSAPVPVLTVVVVAAIVVAGTLKVFATGAQIDVQGRQAGIGDATGAHVQAGQRGGREFWPVWPVVLPVSSTFMVSLPLPTTTSAP